MNPQWVMPYGQMVPMTPGQPAIVMFHQVAYQPQEQRDQRRGTQNRNLVTSGHHHAPSASSPGLHQLSNRVHLTLAAPYYFFSGPTYKTRYVFQDTNNEISARLTVTRDKPSTLEAVTTNGQITYCVAYGAGDSWYRHYHQNRLCYTSRPSHEMKEKHLG